MLNWRNFLLFFGLKLDESKHFFNQKQKAYYNFKHPQMKNFQIISLENEKDPEYDEELERGIFLFSPFSKNIN